MSKNKHSKINRVDRTAVVIEKKTATASDSFESNIQRCFGYNTSHISTKCHVFIMFSISSSSAFFFKSLF